MTTSNPAPCPHCLTYARERDDWKAQATAHFRMAEKGVYVKTAEYSAQVDALSTLRAENARLVEAMRETVARADDYADSWLSQPVRKALSTPAENPSQPTSVNKGE